MNTTLNKTLFRLEQAIQFRPKKEEVTIFTADAIRLAQLLKEQGVKAQLSIVEENKGKVQKRGSNYYREF